MVARSPALCSPFLQTKTSTLSFNFSSSMTMKGMEDAVWGRWYKRGLLEEVEDIFRVGEVWSLGLVSGRLAGRKEGRKRKLSMKSKQGEGVMGFRESAPYTRGPQGRLIFISFFGTTRQKKKKKKRKKKESVRQGPRRSAHTTGTPSRTLGDWSRDEGRRFHLATLRREVPAVVDIFFSSAGRWN